jgi:hypothetical protein
MNNKHRRSKEGIAVVEAFVAKMAARQGLTHEQVYAIHPAVAARRVATGNQRPTDKE